MRKQVRKWFCSKSYLKKFFVGFLAMLTVPILTVVLLFARAQSLLKEQIQVASQNTLDMFFQRVDDMVKGAFDICVTVTRDGLCRQYPLLAERKPEKNTFQIWQITQFLSKYNAEMFYDIFVYYPIDDRVISGKNSAQKLDAYYNVYYGDGHDFLREFRDVAESTIGKPVLRSMNGKGTDTYLCVAMNLGGAKVPESGFTVVVVLDPDYTEQMMRSAGREEQDGISLICSESGDVIFSTDDAIDVYQSEEQGEPEGAVYADVLQGQKYMMQVRESRVVTAQYIYGVPYRYFWEKLFDLYTVSIIGIAVSIVIGIYLAWKETKRMYGSLGVLVSNIEEKQEASYDDKVSTEYEFIEELFNREMKEKAKLSRSVRDSENMKRDRFIYSLLNGNEQDMSGTNAIFLKNGIALRSDKFLVVVFLVEKKGNIIENDLLFFVISNVFLELGNREHSAYMVSLPAGRYAILLNVEGEANEESILPVLEEGKLFLQCYYEIALSFGISSVQEGMQGIHAAYEEACMALRYRYLVGRECTITYRQVAGREFRYLPASDARLLYRISEYLFGDKEAVFAEQLLEEIISDYGIDSSASMEMVECFRFECASAMNRVLIQVGCWSDEWKFIVKELLDEATLREFLDKLAQVLTMLRRIQEEKKEGEDVCMKVWEYIRVHYMDAQLSLIFLGDIFKLTPSYLSRLFKEKYQVSIPDFIVRTRIHNAKLQLRNTNDNLQKVAENNGFLSSTVFIKTFKKLEGITPGGYREMFEAEGSTPE